MAFIIFFFFFFKKFEKVEKTVFLGLILRFSNLNVLHKGLLLQDWVFRQGIYCSSQSKKRISLEAGCSMSKCRKLNQYLNNFWWIQKLLMAFTQNTGLPCTLKTELQPQGCSQGNPSMPRNFEKVQNYPLPVKWATVFRANPAILRLQIIV